MLLNILDTFCEDYANLIIFVINIFVLLIMISLFIYIRKSKKHWNKMNDYLGNVTKTVNSIRYGDLTKKIEHLDIPNSSDLTESLNRMIETLHDREVMLTEYQNDLAKQNRILVEIINSLSDGLLIVDENDKIIRASMKISNWFNQEGQDIVGNYLYEYVSVPRKKPTPFLNND